MPNSQNLPKYLIRELKQSDWSNMAELFGTKGACGGCWCMYWRLPQGGKLWDQSKGEPNRQAMEQLVLDGKVTGLLAFEKRQPIGWCSFGKRTEFPRTERMKAYRIEKIESVWSINCFYIPPQQRGYGLAEQMVAKAIKAIKRRKGKLIEAYPVTLTKKGGKLPAAFSHAGPEIIFKRQGFVEVQRLSQSRPLYRLELP